MPQAQLLDRVQALLVVLPDMDVKLQAMRPADVVSGACCQATLGRLAASHWPGSVALPAATTRATALCHQVIC
jgi:hypothetical protein